MYCSNCGKQLPDESAFCPFCGASLNSPTSAPASSPDTEPIAAPAPEAEPAGEASAAVTEPAGKKWSRKPIILTIIALLLVGLIAAGLVYWFGGAKRKAVEAVKIDFKVYSTPVSAEEYCSFYPKEFLEQSAKESGMTFEDAMESLENDLQQTYEYAQKNGDAEKYKIYSVDVKSVENLPSDKLESLRSTAVFKIDEAKVVTVKVHALIDGRDQTIDNLEVNVIRCGLKWYINPYAGIHEAHEEETPHENHGD